MPPDLFFVALNYWQSIPAESAQLGRGWPVSCASGTMAALPIRPDSMPSTLAPPPAPPALESLGQVFTPESVVRCMLRLRHNTGRVLEPSCGDGAFLKHLHHAVGI